MNGTLVLFFGKNRAPKIPSDKTELKDPRTKKNMIVNTR